MGELLKIMQKTFSEHFEKQAERNKRREDEDYDADVEEQLEEEDDEDVFVLSKLGDVIHALFSTYKEAMVPVFDQMLPNVIKLLVSGAFLTVVRLNQSCYQQGLPCQQ